MVRQAHYALIMDTLSLSKGEDMRRHPFLLSLIVTFGIVLFLGALFSAVLYFSSSNRGGWLQIGDIAVVEIDGPIFDSTEIIKELHHYGKNKSIKALVLRIDSPGGAVAPSQEIFEEVKKLKKDKKIVVSMGTVAASGAYYIAAAADKILASPGTVTGSIGVIMESMSFQELIKWAHVESRVIKSGKFKDVGSPFREMLPEERAYLQSLLDNMYSQFKTAVAESRGFTPEQIDLIAEGKIYTGEQAVNHKLIDGLGTLYDAIEEAKRLAGLPADARIIWPTEKRLPFESLFFESTAKNSLEHFMKKYFHGLDMPVWMYSMSLNPIKD